MTTNNNYRIISQKEDSIMSNNSKASKNPIIACTAPVPNVHTANAACLSFYDPSSNNIVSDVLKETTNLAVEETKVLAKVHSDTAAIKSEVQKSALNATNGISSSANTFFSKEAEERTNRHESTLNKLDSIEDPRIRANAIIAVHRNDNATSIFWGGVAVICTGLICNAVKCAAGPKTNHFSIF